jgi:hypothetical protein
MSTVWNRAQMRNHQFFNIRPMALAARLDLELEFTLTNNFSCTAAEKCHAEV